MLKKRIDPLYKNNNTTNIQRLYYMLQLGAGRGVFPFLCIALNI